MGLASYRGGVADLEADPLFDDLVASARMRLRRADPSALPDAIERTAREQTYVDLLRNRHAEQAEDLMTRQFQTSDAEPFFLLQDASLRHMFGSLIGRIAHSHWWDVADLRNLEQPLGSCVDHPAHWEVDPLKIACVLRLADAAQIDHRRAPTYLHAFRKPTGASRDHWYFQERLTRPRVDADRLVYTATRPFGRDEAAAWWLAYDIIREIDRQLRRVDALCADLGRPRFAVRSVAGVDSPDRLASYIRADRWEPLDAALHVGDVTQLIANLGGRDLYGHNPEVAVRELIANGADATRARRVIEGGHGGAVTVRLLAEGEQWWLEVEDHGVGMKPETMVSALTDFGHSRWQALDMLQEFPGLLSRGFQATGRFGIGFFAVFMVADHVEVRSRAYDEAPRSTHVLEFRHGLATRPLLRAADPHEWLRGSGTVVRVRLNHDPRTMDGLFKTTNRKLTHTQLLHSRLTRMCALSDVDIRVQGPDDPHPVRIIQGGDWTRISRSELFRRVYRRDEASHSDRLIYDGYERLFVDRATDLCDEGGNVVGRAMVASGYECVHPDLRWMRAPKAGVYVGGLVADDLYYCMGAFVGYPLKADRLSAFPVAGLNQLQAWMDRQADVISTSAEATAFDRGQLGFLLRALSAEAPQLPLVISSAGPLDRNGLVDWLAGREQILLVSVGALWAIHRESKPPLFVTFNDGSNVDLPNDCLLVSMNPLWELPEEVCPKPRDERFADAVESPSRWDPGAWWYDTGNFGAVGVTVRTIAKEWGIDIVDAVRLMEPLHLQDDGDFRPALPTADGGTVRVTAIRMVRPRPG
jgi:signal transduction histidine kinase